MARKPIPKPNSRRRPARAVAARRRAPAPAPRSRAAKPRPRRRRAAAPAGGPAGGPLTQAQYARRRGVSREAVSKAVRDGRIKLDARGKLNPAAADAAWAANTDPNRGGKAGATPPPDPAPPPPTAAAGELAPPGDVEPGEMPAGMTLNAARMLREWNQAMKISQERRKEAGELVEAADVEDAAFRASRTVRDLLMAVPDRVDADFASITDPTEIHRKLSAELRKICDDFSRLLMQDEESEEAAS